MVQSLPSPKQVEKLPKPVPSSGVGSCEISSLVSSLEELVVGPGPGSPIITFIHPVRDLVGWEGGMWNLLAWIPSAHGSDLDVSRDELNGNLVGVQGL